MGEENLTLENNEIEKLLIDSDFFGRRRYSKIISI